MKASRFLKIIQLYSRSFPLRIGARKFLSALERSFAAKPGCLSALAVKCAAFISAFLLTTGCHSEKKVVVVYTSQDQEYAEPILRIFTEKTGIEVRPLYDNESVKTVGLVTRLLAEKDHPQCDVFWNNEEMRSRQLKNKGVFLEENGLFACGYRSRRIVINTNHLSLLSGPKSLEALTNKVWKGKIALAYPLFGTTATHFMALRPLWGDAEWREWCQALVDNKPFLLDGNSVVVKQVGRGEAWIGLTDSDDIAAGKREGLPIEALPLGPESLLIPNTIGIVNNAPHMAEAKKLAEFLSGPECLKLLVAANALEGAYAPTGSSGTLPVNWSQVITNIESTTAELKSLFLAK